MGLNQSDCNCAISSEWIDPEAPCTCWEVVSLCQTHRQVFQHALVFYADQPKQEYLKEFYRGDAKLRINRELKIISKSWTWSAFFEVKVIRMEQAGIYRLHRLVGGSSKAQRWQKNIFFSSAVTKNATWFQGSCNNRRIGKQKVLILVSASHPCVTLVFFYSGHSPQMHLQQSTQQINTDKISVNARYREKGATRTIFKL